jgi:hypothetical protein
MDRTAALRADWYAQLADAIDAAQRVAWHLRINIAASVEARELYERLGQIRSEVDRLQIAGGERMIEIEPDWLGRLGLRRPTTDFE